MAWEISHICTYVYVRISIFVWFSCIFIYTYTCKPSIVIPLHMNNQANITSIALLSIYPVVCRAATFLTAALCGIEGFLRNMAVFVFVLHVNWGYGDMMVTEWWQFGSCICSTHHEKNDSKKELHLGLLITSEKWFLTSGTMFFFVVSRMVSVM